MGDYAKKRASVTTVQPPADTSSYVPEDLKPYVSTDIVDEQQKALTAPVTAPAVSTGQPVPITDESVTNAMSKTGQVPFNAQLATQIGSPEQVRKFLLQKYGAGNVWGTASGNWFVRKADKWMKATPDDFSMASAAGALLPMAGGVLGAGLAAPAAVATGNPMIESLGFGLGTGAGEALNKVAAGIMMGPSEESPLKQAGDIATSVATGTVADVAAVGAKQTLNAVGKAIEGTGIGKKILAPFASDVDRPLVNAAREMGITLTPGEISTNPKIKQLTAALRSAIGASSQFANLEAPRFKLFKQYVDNYVADIGKPTSRFKSFGDALMNSIEKLRVERLGKTDIASGNKIPGVSDMLFEDVHRIANASFPVRPNAQGTGGEALLDVKPIKQMAIDLSEDLGRLNNSIPKLNKIAQEEDIITFQEALDLRSDLISLAKSKEMVGTRANRIAAIMVGKVDATIRDQARQYGVENTLIPALKKARSYYEKASRLFNEGVVAAIARQSPTDVAKTIVTMNRAEDVRNMKLILNKTNPELWNKSVASTFDYAFNYRPGFFGKSESSKAPTVFGNKLSKWWSTLLPEVKQSLLTPEQRRSMDKIVLAGSELPIGNIPQGWAGRTIAMSKGSSVTAQLGFGVLGYGGATASGMDPVTAGLIGLGTLWFLPTTAAKMILSKEGRALLGEGLHLSRIGSRPSVKFMTRLGVYLKRPEFEGDMEHTQQRLRAAQLLGANKLDASEKSIDEFLAKNPNFK